MDFCILQFFDIMDNALKNGTYIVILLRSVLEILVVKGEKGQ